MLYEYLMRLSLGDIHGSDLSNILGLLCKWRFHLPSFIRGSLGASFRDTCWLATQLRSEAMEGDTVILSALHVSCKCKTITMWTMTSSSAVSLATLGPQCRGPCVSTLGKHSPRQSLSRSRDPLRHSELRLLPFKLLWIFTCWSLWWAGSCPGLLSYCPNAEHFNSYILFLIMCLGCKVKLAWVFLWNNCTFKMCFCPSFCSSSL